MEIARSRVRVESTMTPVGLPGEDVLEPVEREATTNSAKGKELSSA